MPPSIDRETHRRNAHRSNSNDDNDEQAGRRVNHDHRRNHHHHTNNNTMTLPQVTPEQMQEFYAQRIFGAAVGRLAADQQERGGEGILLEPGSESELMRHSRSVAAEMPPTLDETYVLRLQSQLALARYSMDRMATTTAAAADGVADESNLAAASSMTARQLASAAARLRRHDAQMQAEATQSLGLVAELQVDLARTRERMSDALSVARSTHSSRSINFEADLDLLNEVSNANADHNSDAASLDRADLNRMDDFIVGPLELDLNDVEPEASHRHQPQQHRSAPLLPTHNQPQPQEQGEERTVNDEAELLASIASLQFDLLQTRERLMDERSFSHSHHIEDVIPALEEATPEASESTIEGISAQNQSQEEEEQPAAGEAAAAAAERSQQEAEVDDATARLASLTTVAAAPKTSGDSSVRGTKIRSQGDLVFRRFSNQMA